MEWESVVMESLSSPPAPGVTMATTFQGKPPSAWGEKKKWNMVFEIRNRSVMHRDVVERKERPNSFSLRCCRRRHSLVMSRELCAAHNEPPIEPLSLCSSLRASWDRKARRRKAALVFLLFLHSATVKEVTSARRERERLKEASEFEHG